ncbi:MAG: 50S ribosomal protein L30 [Betaproteobacteria bacterium]|nr:50S ribosomal protein L30 [Betaproteobacteria bacterium]MBI2959459.1 50S ribosomal protein L30 [Betaproteobacteria bacterium]
MAEKRFKVTLVKSPIGCKQAHRATVRAMGLRRISQTVELPDTPQARGMALSVAYLVRCED